jgi:CubicO group peptidase (beta-lactamase class C family)
MALTVSTSFSARFTFSEKKSRSTGTDAYLLNVVLALAGGISWSTTMIRSISAMLFMLALAASACADAIDDYLSSEIRDRHIPGLGLAVVRDGHVEKLAAYGLANVELNVPASPQSVFQIQSVTKTLTSTAILMLFEEGKLALDDPIGKHLEGTPDSWKEITLRHLLSHTSGIKDFINEPTASIRLDVSEEDVLRATAPRPLNFQPGEKYAYSNTNYHLLAMVIRKITGKSYGEFLKEWIFAPLAMTDTRVQSLREVIPNRAAGYQWAGGRLRNGDFVAESILAYGGGGVISTVSDMAKWAVALDEGKVLKKETIEMAWTGAKLNDGKTSGYGLGWGVGLANGHRFVGHSGSHATGFTSSVVRYCDDRITVVVLTNAGHANPSKIAHHVAGIYIPALAPKEGAKAIEDKEPKVTALLREVGEGIRAGKLEEAKFTPAMWGALSPQMKDLQASSQQDGKLKSLELLARWEEGGQKQLPLPDGAGAADSPGDARAGKRRPRGWVVGGRGMRTRSSGQSAARAVGGCVNRGA